MADNNQISDLKKLSDEQLVTVFQAGGKPAIQAYSVLAVRHQPALLSRCNARLANTADAEEAVQETLLRGFRGLLRFRGDACFRTWLFAIADNQCNSLFVRRSRFVLTDHVRAMIALPTSNHYHEELVEEAERAQVVRQVLATLPRKAIAVLILRFYCDHSIEDIAVTLGIGLSAAKMRLYRAVAQFESKMTAGIRELVA